MGTAMAHSNCGSVPCRTAAGSSQISMSGATSGTHVGVPQPVSSTKSRLITG